MSSAYVHRKARVTTSWSVNCLVIVNCWALELLSGTCIYSHKCHSRHANERLAVLREQCLPGKKEMGKWLTLEESSMILAWNVFLWFKSRVGLREVVSSLLTGGLTFLAFFLTSVIIPPQCSVSGWRLHKCTLTDCWLGTASCFSHVPFEWCVSHHLKKMMQQRFCHLES